MRLAASRSVIEDDRDQSLCRMGLLAVAVLHWVCFGIMVYQHYVPASGSGEHSSGTMSLFALVSRAVSHVS